MMGFSTKQFDAAFSKNKTLGNVKFALNKKRLGNINNSQHCYQMHNNTIVRNVPIYKNIDNKKYTKHAWEMCIRIGVSAKLL